MHGDNIVFQMYLKIGIYDNVRHRRGNVKDIRCNLRSFQTSRTNTKYLKNVNIHWTVGELQIALHELTGIPLQKQQLYHRGINLLNYKEKQLYHLYFLNGDLVQLVKILDEEFLTGFL